MAARTRISNLLELSKVSPLIELGRKEFKKYIADSQKTYSFIIMAVTRNCNWCQSALGEMNLVAKAYRTSAYDSTNLFFGVAYIEDVPDVVKIVIIEENII